MDLFTFILHPDPTKVRIGERELAESKVKLLKMTEGHTVLLDPLVTTALGDSGDSIDKLFDEGNDAGQEHSVERKDDVLEETVAKDASEDTLVITVVVTTTVIVDASIVLPLRVRVVSKNLEIVADYTFTGGVNVDVVGTSKWNEPVDSLDSFYVSQDLDYDTLHRIYVLKWNVTNDSVLDYPYLYFEFNVGAARHVCLGAEVRMRAEHTLEKKEAETTKVIRLRGQLTIVEAADTAKGDELRDLKEKNFALEGERDVMSENISTFESANAAKEAELASLSSRVAKLLIYLAFSFLMMSSIL
nr:hypothetical protein [Tanacetum cinerariifolium]